MDLYKKILVFKDFLLYGRLKTNFCIIDIETTGLDPKQDKIIAFGYIYMPEYSPWKYPDKIEARTYVLKDPSEYKQFYRWLKATVRALQEGFVLYAYNKKFEEAFLGVDGIRDLLNGYWGVCYDYEFGDPYDCIKLAKMRYVARFIIEEKRKEIPEQVLKLLEELEDVSNKEVPEVYLRDWLLHRDTKALEIIANHNLIDLIEEFLIYQYIIGLISELKRQLERKRYFPLALRYLLESFLE